MKGKRNEGNKGRYKRGKRKGKIISWKNRKGKEILETRNDFNN